LREAWPTSDYKTGLYMNYYNEIDPFAAQWLRNLIKVGLIPDGYVDERAIQDVEAEDLEKYTQCHFFAGIAGWSYALELAGWPEDQQVWTGSPPCQPFSSAGKRKGMNDDRHLWPHFFSLIRECQPPVIFGEQVATAIGDSWFDYLQADLEAEGYATGMAVLPACSVNAPHRRNRLWFVAYSIWNQQSWEKSCSRKTRRVGRKHEPVSWDRTWQSALSEFRALDDGIPRSVAGTDAARNAIVPQVAAEIIKTYMDYKDEIST